MLNAEFKEISLGQRRRCFYFNCWWVQKQLSWCCACDTSPTVEKHHCCCWRGLFHLSACVVSQEETLNSGWQEKPSNNIVCDTCVWDVAYKRFFAQKHVCWGKNPCQKLCKRHRHSQQGGISRCQGERKEVTADIHLICCKLNPVVYMWQLINSHQNY